MHTVHPANAPTAPRLTWAQALLCACMAASLMVTANEAHAARKTKTSAAMTSASVSKKGSVKIKHHRSPSEESTAERERRLYRECKGLPNAGACLGYARR